MWSEDSICYKCSHQNVCSRFWNLIPNFDARCVVQLTSCDDYMLEE